MTLCVYCEDKAFKNNYTCPCNNQNYLASYLASLTTCNDAKMLSLRHRFVANFTFSFAQLAFLAY